MRSGIIGGMLGVFLGAGVLVFMTMACGGSGAGGGGPQLVVGESILAAAQVDGHPTTPVVNRFINHMAPTVTVTRSGVGQFHVDFGFDVSNRYFAATLGGPDGSGVPATYTVSLEPRLGEPNTVSVYLADPHAGILKDFGGFYITVY